MSTVVADKTERAIQASASLPHVIRMTQELFSGQVTTEVMSDPESSSESWIVLNVEVTGQPKELVKLRCEWHERLAQQFPECVRDLRLSIVPPA
jgi:hypothetical protein